MLVRKSEELFSARNHNGMFLIEGLRDIDGIILPKISGDMYVVFNRLPVVFKDPRKRKEAGEALWKNGIDASWIYDKPLHHEFDMGYGKEDFPNAVYCARRLLTLPVHAGAGEKDLLKIIETIRNI